MPKAEREQKTRSLAPEHALTVLREVILVRRFEERAEKQYTRSRIGGAMNCLARLRSPRVVCSTSALCMPVPMRCA